MPYEDSIKRRRFNRGSYLRSINKTHCSDSIVARPATTAHQGNRQIEGYDFDAGKRQCNKLNAEKSLSCYQILTNAVDELCQDPGIGMMELAGKQPSEFDDQTLYATPVSSVTSKINFNGSRDYVGGQLRNGEVASLGGSHKNALPAPASINSSQSWSSLCQTSSNINEIDGHEEASSYMSPTSVDDNNEQKMDVFDIVKRMREDRLFKSMADHPELSAFCEDGPVLNGNILTPNRSTIENPKIEALKTSMQRTINPEKTSKFSFTKRVSCNGDGDFIKPETRSSKSNVKNQDGVWRSSRPSDRPQKPHSPLQELLRVFENRENLNVGKVEILKTNSEQVLLSVRSPSKKREGKSGFSHPVSSIDYGNRVVEVYDLLKNGDAKMKTESGKPSKDRFRKKDKYFMVKICFLTCFLFLYAFGLLLVQLYGIGQTQILWKAIREGGYENDLTYYEEVGYDCVE